MCKSRLVLFVLFAAATAATAGPGAGRHFAFDLTASPALADVEGLRPARVAGQARKPVVDPAYRIYRISEGVTSPKLVTRKEPKYSPEAREAKVQGKVVLETLISPNGMPEAIKMIEGLEPSLDKNAVDAVRQWAFEPGMKDGKPVPVRARIEVYFKLK